MGFGIPKILFTIVTLVATVNAGCPSMCECSEGLVGCRSELLEGVPNFESLDVTAETIDLSDNSIFSIFATDFSFDGNENVKYLYLNNNHIADIHEMAFSELKNVREINLNTNSLDSIPPMFVADNTQLVSLDLSNNFFDLITPEIYSETLEVLDLSSTKISSFGEANIKYMPNLKIINLSYNRLNVIEPSVFAENLPNLLAVDLTGNIWNCDQKTIDLFDFLTNKGLTDVIEPVKCKTEDDFYQDIYTSSGPVDIFSFRLEEFDDNAALSSQQKQEIEDESKVPKTADNIEGVEQSLEKTVNEEVLDDMYLKIDSNNENLEKLEGEFDDITQQESLNDQNIDGSSTKTGNEEIEHEETENQNVGSEDISNEEKVENFEDEQYVNDEGLQDDNQEAANSDFKLADDENLRDVLEDFIEKNEEVDSNEDDTAENSDEETDAAEKTGPKLDDKSLEEIILEKTGKSNPADITDTDIVDAINQLLKEEEEAEEDTDEYGEDYWENGNSFGIPEKPEEETADEEKERQEDEEALEQALKVVEEEHMKENAAKSTSEPPEDSPELGISVIREDQYIVLLERDSPDESQYGIYFRNNIVSTLGIMAFVLAFITGIFFGLYAIREVYTRRRRRNMHGSTSVLINKWSEDLA